MVPSEKSSLGFGPGLRAASGGISNGMHSRFLTHSQRLLHLLNRQRGSQARLRPGRNGPPFRSCESLRKFAKRAVCTVQHAKMPKVVKKGSLGYPSECSFQTSGGRGVDFTETVLIRRVFGGALLLPRIMTDNGTEARRQSRTPFLRSMIHAATASKVGSSTRAAPKPNVWATPRAMADTGALMVSEPAGSPATASV